MKQFVFTLCLIFLIILSCSVENITTYEDDYGYLYLPFDDTLNLVKTQNYSGTIYISQFGTTIATLSMYSKSLNLYSLSNLPNILNLNSYYADERIYAYYISDSLIYLSLDNNIIVVDFPSDHIGRTLSETEIDYNCDAIISIDSFLIVSDSYEGVALYKINDDWGIDLLYLNNKLCPDTIVFYDNYLYAMDYNEIRILQIENDSLVYISRISSNNLDNLYLYDSILLFQSNTSIGIVDISNKLYPKLKYLQDFDVNCIFDIVFDNSNLYFTDSLIVWKYNYSDSTGFVFDALYKNDKIKQSIICIDDYVIATCSYSDFMIFEK